MRDGLHVGLMRRLEKQRLVRRHLLENHLADAGFAAPREPTQQDFGRLVDGRSRRHFLGGLRFLFPDILGGLRL